jgi:hypothetical protein
MGYQPVITIFQGCMETKIRTISIIKMGIRDNMGGPPMGESMPISSRENMEVNNRMMSIIIKIGISK